MLATLLTATLLASSVDSTQATPRTTPAFVSASPLGLRLMAEAGFLGVLSHTLQLGSNGTEIDYVEDGRQDNLYAWTRFQAEASWRSRHIVAFLYQPLDLSTQAVLSRDLVIEGLTFPQGTPVDFRYGFPFYRASYLYNFLRAPGDELSVGASLQLRNATLSFTSADGELRRVNDDIGPVPLLKFRARKGFDSGYFVGTELDGIYVSGRYVSGSTNDFIGSLLDLSLFAGAEVSPSADVFLNVRFLAGGARGVEENSDSRLDDGFTRNWLYTLTVSLGFALKVPSREG